MQNSFVKTDRNLLKITVVLLFLISSLIGSAVQAESQPKDISDEIVADAWVVMDSQSGEILLEKNKDKRHFPASITKIVTAIMAIEQRDLNEVVTVSQHAADTEGSSLYLKKGDKVILKDLLYGIMLHSGNDGAVATAEHLAGNEVEFARRMTLFVRSIGAKNTNFVNASGLPNENHYTTAYDMAVITRYAMQNPIFREIVSTKGYRWSENLWSESLGIHEKDDALQYGVTWTGQPMVVNHNRLLKQYEGATGIKNGFTHEARYTLVGAAERNDTELIAVILRSTNVDTAYQDITKLLDHGFSIAPYNLKQDVDFSSQQVNRGRGTYFGETKVEIEDFKTTEQQTETKPRSEKLDDPPLVYDLFSIFLKLFSFWW